MDNPIGAIAEDPQGTADRLAMLPTVAGVVIAGVADGEITVGAAGTADAETGAPVRPNSIFRPGSMTKLLTATLVMQCVRDGLLSFDDPVARYLPDVPVVTAKPVTVRHLISHSSGIDAGDIFVDTGDGADCLARYLDLFAETGYLFEPGETFSYCNGGFVAAGRIVELARGTSWEDAVRTHLFEPFGMGDSDFVTWRESGDVDADRHVRGHTAGFGAPTPISRVIDDPMCSRGLGPAGGTLVSTAADLARFLLGNLALDPSAEMRSLQAAAPGGVAQMLGAGLGWMVWHGSNRVGGANPGQSGQIVVDPSGRHGFVALTNSDQGVNAISALLAGPGEPTGEPPTDLSVYAGTYRSHAMEVDVSAGEGGLSVRMVGQPDTGMLTPVDRVTFASAIGPVAFVDLDGDGVPELTRWRMRALRRVS